MSEFLYHFTHQKNIESIKKHGLMSWSRLHKLNIDHLSVANGLSRHLDEAKGLENYIRFSDHQKHPMLHSVIKRGLIHWDDVAWIRIPKRAIYWPSALFSDTNATSNYALISDGYDLFLESDDLQAEVMIKAKILPKWLQFSY
jgi:hypothetical protein